MLSSVKIISFIVEKIIDEFERGVVIMANNRGKEVPEHVVHADEANPIARAPHQHLTGKKGKEKNVGRN